jgi:hypothetical protein
VELFHGSRARCVSRTADCANSGLFLLAPRWRDSKLALFCD